MKILAMEPYYGGSHKAFIDGWVGQSCHDWTVLTLPPNKWKWRMRHSAVSFARQVNEQTASGQNWDILFCSDMLNLAEFAGLADKTIANLPKVIYFHENQLTYPVRVESERDYQFAMTNMTSALAADKVWFNSAFHRDEFLEALKNFLKRMPDNQPVEAVEIIKSKSEIHPPGIEPIERQGKRKPGPLQILWACRWEHDKNPEDFFQALKAVKEKGFEFRLSVIGEQFREYPVVFDEAKVLFAQNIDHWGYQESDADYRSALTQADIVVSTAGHEFFGISVVEAIAAGAYPILPKRLAYPEILSGIKGFNPDEFFYDGTAKGLIDKIVSLIEKNHVTDSWYKKAEPCRLAMQKYAWQKTAATMDKRLEALVWG